MKVEPCLYQPVCHNDTPVISSLLGKSLDYVPIVCVFVNRLQEQLDALDEALRAKDYKAVEELAHGLKGSGGSVGFAGITAIASDLEVHAKASSDAAVADSISQLNCYSQRIFAGWVYRSSEGEQPASRS